ncbi:MAG: glycosyltransferase family 2 protein [Anaerolineales bacterium]
MNTKINTQALSSLTTTAIIPAYNESKGIGQVLDVLEQVILLSEIIIVDDGSTDDTFSIIQSHAQREPRIRIIHHEKNKGKGQAVYDAMLEVNTPIVMTLDADLIGLKPEHITQLLEPLYDKKIDMSLGIFRGGKFRTDMSHWLTPWLSGQRALWLSHLQKIYWPAAEGYGLETAITAASQRYHWKTQKVYWYGVSHPPSEEHRGLFKGGYNRTRMYVHIIRAWITALRGDRKAKKVDILTY